MEIKWVKRSVCLILLFSGSMQPAHSQSSFNRQYQPLTLKGSTFPAFTGVNISTQGNELFLYAYDAANDAWAQIPFQFDEVASDGTYFTADDGVLDNNDELTFMPRDGGDRAFVWINDEDSQGYIRYEIELSDPLDPGGASKWVYLYRSTTLRLDPNLTDYVVYSPPGSVPGADAVQTPYYQLANSSTGLPENLTISSATNGAAAEILDRLKFRASGKYLGFITFNATEDALSIEDFDVIDGLVRVIRRQDAVLTVLGQSFNFPISPAFFYPHSVSINMDVPAVSNVSINFARMSLDLNANASGSKFVSAQNPEPGVTINGSPDQPNVAINPVLPDNNWYYINGSFGTLVHLFPFPTTNGQARLLYYKDDSSNDDNDTGDKQSYGDTGIQILEDISLPTSLVYKGYFLDANQTSSIGADIAAQERTPLNVEATEQDFGSVPVELVAFDVTVETNDITLSWVTATETNNFGFDIERRTDGAEWFKIGFVEGYGTTTEPRRYEFIDADLSPGTHEYRLKQIDIDGTFEYSSIVAATITLPEGFALQQNYPNPFNPETTISYRIPVMQTERASSAEKAVLTVYNLKGEVVRVLVNKVQSPGEYTVAWDGTDTLGRSVTSGVYIYQLRVGAFVESKKMLLVK